MSTKTTFKRVALVAVAALGFGVLSSVSPARAAGPMELATSIAAGTSESHRAGSMSFTPIVINLPSTAAETDTVVVSVALLTAPATSTLASVAANPTQSAFVGAANTNGGTLNWALGSSGSGSQGTFAITNSWSTSGNATATAQYTIGANDSPGQITLRVGFKPDVSGTYTFLVSTPNAIADVAGLPANGGAYYTASSADTSTAFSITTRATPTALALAAVTTGAPSGTGEFGQIFRLTPSDGTANTLLGSTETITLSTGDSSVTFAATPDANPNTTATTLVVGRDTTGWVGGSFFFRVDNSSATSESVTITATGSGTLASSVSTSIGTTFTAVSATSVAFTSVDGTAGGTDTSAVATSGSTATAGDYTVVSGDSSHSLRATITTQAANVESWTITDTSRKITGYATAAAKYGRTITNAAADTNAFKDITVAATLGRPNGVADSFTATLNSLVTRSITFTAAAATKTAIVVTNSNRRVATGSANTFVAELDDQTGVGMANESVTVTIAGRNGATASSTLVTNSLGQVSYTLTDVGTVGTTDTITFTSGSATGTATLTYGTTTVTTLDILGPNDSAANTPDANVTLSERTGISVAIAGASAAAGRATVTVTAKDANGVVMAGVPVTFTVAGTTAAILSTHQSRFTAADGTASTLVYAWANGSYVVTATAGGKTATSTVFFAQKDATAARTITAAVSGGTVTATVKDRYGNPVPNVTVWATKSGTGFFGSGSSSTSGATNEAGVVDFYVNGSASITLQLGSSTAADATYGQSASAAGAVKQGEAASAAVTASAAGTATTAETGVGAAFAPAGINSVTVAVEAGVSEAQTAADAAAEATDAANAATDAANAAAEAADAATAAAQDAADAVAALSTSVSAMISDLKRQITALTNLVIKIQRKVRA
jgi:trimeric autotransporter adhesin